MRQRLWLLGAIVAVMSLLIAVPAIAAPPLPDAGIALEADTEAAATAAAPDTAHYGDSVTFDHWIDGKVAKKYYLTIGVYCYQDGARVYQWYGQPDFAFPLRDQNSTQWTWDGNDADCVAHLRYFANNRLSVIAETNFAVYAAS